MPVISLLGHVPVLTLPRSTALISLLLTQIPPKAGSGLCFHDLVLRFGLHGRCLERNICKEALEMPTWIAPHSVDSVGTTLGSQWLVHALPALRGRVGASLSACLCHWKTIFPSGRAVLGGLLSLGPREHFHVCRPRWGPSGP